MAGRFSILSALIFIAVGLSVGNFLCQKGDEEKLKDFLSVTGRVEHVSSEIMGNRPRWNYREIGYSYQVAQKTYRGGCQLASDIRILSGASIEIRVAKAKPSLSTCDSEATKASLSFRDTENLVKSGVFDPLSKNAVRQLFEAIFQDHPRVVDILLKAGVSPDSTYGVDGPAIVYAARLGRLTITMSLIKAGADVNAEDGKGITPIQAACEPEKVAIFNRLKEAGAKGRC